MMYKIIITNSAFSDLESIKLYIAKAVKDEAISRISTSITLIVSITWSRAAFESKSIQSRRFAGFKSI